jgi:hypothetical protein
VLPATNDFQRKWHSNRDAFYALDELLLRAADPNEVSDRQLRQLLVAVVRTQRDSWLRGTEATSVKNEIAELDDASGRT